MRTSIKTLLSLQEWFDIIEYHPYLAAQIGLDVPERSRGDCKSVLFQKNWQNADHLSREEIGQAIQRAEYTFARVMGFYPAPYWIEGEEHPFRSTIYNQYNVLRNFELFFGYIQTAGKQQLDLIEANVAVFLQSVYEPSLSDRFIATLNVPAGTLAENIKVFFNATDRLELSLEETEIKHLTVSVSGNVATIQGDAYLLVKPEFQLVFSPTSLSALNLNIYASEIDVYIESADLSKSADIIWSIRNCENPPCTFSMESGCLSLVDRQYSVVRVSMAEFNETIEAFQKTYPGEGHLPDRVKVNYLAGYPREKNGKMNSNLARIITMLSTAYLPNRTCGCGRSDQRINYWRELPTEQRSAGVVIAVTAEQLNNPFGTGRGAIEAWNLAQNLALYRGAVYE